MCSSSENQQSGILLSFLVQPKWHFVCMLKEKQSDRRSSHSSDSFPDHNFCSGKELGWSWVNHRTLPTALLLAKKDNIDANGEGGSANGQFNVDIFEESNRPALTFFVTLILWHFWIGPYLRPIILAARDR